MANKLKLLENGNVVKFLLFPTLFGSFIGLFIFIQVRLALALYLAMGMWTLNAYKRKEYQEEVYGMKKGVIKNWIIGLMIGGIFLVISSIFPSLSLLTPSLSLSVSEDIRFAIIVLLAPIAEELWRSATIAYIREIYKWKQFWKTNLAQSLGFGALHTLVYGLAFSAYDKWIEVYGVFTAIGGSLLTAVAFGLASGYMMEKFKDVIPSIGAHQIINFWLIKAGLVVVFFVLSLLI